MKTYISDKFPLEKLECQFYDICRGFDPARCGYSDKCLGFLILENDKKVRIREVLRKSLEEFVGKDTLNYEIKLIIDDEKNNSM